jgi:transcriptional regulator with XRE-family HTH domain
MDDRRLTALVGDVLREVRTGRGLSLRQVTVRSGGQFKPSSVASYERGERHISLERLFALAEVYGVAPERIVAAVAYRLEHEGADDARAPVVIDPLGLGTPSRR